MLLRMITYAGVEPAAKAVCSLSHYQHLRRKMYALCLIAFCMLSVSLSTFTAEDVCSLSHYQHLRRLYGLQVFFYFLFFIFYFFAFAFVSLACVCSLSNYQHLRRLYGLHAVFLYIIFRRILFCRSR